MKMAVFWVVEPCSLVEVYRRYRGAIALIMEAASTSETSLNFYQTTRRYNPKDSHLHIRRCENLRSLFGDKSESPMLLTQKPSTELDPQLLQ
jgi:hypothetical protein